MNRKILAIFSTLFSLVWATTNLIAANNVDVRAESHEMFTDEAFMKIILSWNFAKEYAENTLANGQEMPTNLKNIFKEIKKIATEKSEVIMTFRDFCSVVDADSIEPEIMQNMLQQHNIFSKRVNKFYFWIMLFSDDGLKEFHERQFTSFLLVQLKRDNINREDAIDYNIFWRWLTGELYEDDFLKSRGIPF